MRQHAQVRARAGGLAADVDAVDATPCRCRASARRTACASRSTCRRRWRPAVPVISPSRATKETSRAASMAAEALAQVRASIMAHGPVMLTKKRRRACAVRGRPHRACRARRCPETPPSTSARSRWRTWPWPSPLQYQVPMTGEAGSRALGVGGRRHRIRFAGQAAASGISLCKGACRSASTGPRGHSLQISCKASNMVRALVSRAMAARSHVGRGEKRHVLAADHAVLHAARQLIADLPRGHDGLRGQRRAARRAPPRCISVGSSDACVAL